MKTPAIQFHSPIFKNDPEATRQFAAYTAKLQDLLRDIYDNLQQIKILDSAPAAGEVHTVGDGKGNVLSEIIILNDATEGNRKIYYKDKAGNLRTLSSA